MFNNKRIDNLERRVRKLEAMMEFDVLPKEPHYGFWVNPPTISLWRAVKMILEHLRMEIICIPAGHQSFKLTPIEEEHPDVEKAEAGQPGEE